MQTRTIVGVLALLLAAAIILVLILRGGDDRSGNEPASRAGDLRRDDRDRPPPAGAGRVGVPVPRVRGDGANPSSSGGAASGAAAPRTYVTDTGNLVRDHRSDVTDPKAVPAPLPPEQRTMSSTITADIYRSLAPIVRGCTSDVGAGDKGPSPVVHVTLSVEVIGEKLTATDATAVLNDIGGPAADKVLGCVRDRAAGLTADAKGEPDRSNYVVQFPIRVR